MRRRSPEMRLMLDIEHMDALLEAATREADRLRREVDFRYRMYCDVNDAMLRLEADSRHAEALLINTERDRATENARHSQAYVNVDDGYPWLTCGECDELLHCIDGGDRLDTLTQAVNGHACATAQSAEAA